MSVFRICATREAGSDPSGEPLDERDRHMAAIESLDALAARTASGSLIKVRGKDEFLRES